MTMHNISNALVAAGLVLLVAAQLILARPSVFVDYAGDHSVVSQRGNPGRSVTGSYSWTSPEGTEFFVRYVADEFGYRVVESNALQRSAHGQLADGNQVFRSTAAGRKDLTDVQQPQEPVPAADVSAVYDSQEDESSEVHNGGFSVSSRGRIFEGIALIPSVTQSVDDQAFEAVEEAVAVVEAAPQREVPAVRTDSIEPVHREEEASEIAQAQTETMKVDALEAAPQEQESATQASPAEVATETTSEGGRPLEDTKEEAVAPAAPEAEVAEAEAAEAEVADVIVTAAESQADTSSGAALEEEVPAETEATPAETEEPVTVETSV